MLFGIVDCSTSLSPSTSASPILKLFEIRRTRSKCPRCHPELLATGNGAHFKGGYAVTSGGGGGGGGLLTTLPRRSTELRRQLAW